MTYQLTHDLTLNPASLGVPNLSISIDRNTFRIPTSSALYPSVEAAHAKNAVKIYLLALGIKHTFVVQMILLPISRNRGQRGVLGALRPSSRMKDAIT